MKNKKIKLIAFAIVLLIVFSVAVFAWLSQIVDKVHAIISTGVEVTPVVYFLQEDSITKIPAPRDNDGYYIVDTENPNAINYVKKLRVDIKYKGLTHSYLKVYVGDMWYIKDDFVDTAYLREDTYFEYDDVWFDNRWWDNYYYFKGSLQYTDGSDGGEGIIFTNSPREELTIPFIKGIKNFAPIVNGELKLEVRAETVQINRIEAFWKMSQLPN